jgi:predicted metal-dependent hydrolase
VQLDLPFLRTAEPPPDPPPVEYPDIEFVRTPRARRYILRVRPGGGLRVTIPRGGSRAEAARFVQRQTAWIEQERARVRARGGPVVWRHGAALLLRGERVQIELLPAEGEAVARYGDRIVRIPPGAVDLRNYIERDLRALARAELGPKLRELADRHGLAVAGFSIRDQKSRWGSCSRHGRIALNFRLVQMPPFVSDYVLLHELMHLKQQNHSRRFWRLVEVACPEYRAAERWLKTEGRSLF